MSSWSPTGEQKAAIEYPCDLIVIARPGSGKTYILSEKIRLILPTLPQYRGVIALSYTNKASDELKKRSSREGVNLKSSFFGTIDKFCDREIIIQFLSHIWGKPTSEIVIHRIRDLESDEQEKFSRLKENQMSMDDLVNHLDILEMFYKQGCIFLETNSALALYVLKHSLACRRYISTRYSHIIIDEYQDSGVEQNELFLQLKELGLIAVAVGDADQSIFGFSGKDSKYLLAIAKRGDFKSFPVSFNHRCHPSIINYSQVLLNERSERLTVDEIRVFEKTCDGTQEAVAEWIDQALPEILEKYKVQKYSEIGILVRGGKSGEIIDHKLLSKHRYFFSTPLEEHFSLWSKLFCQLLRLRYSPTHITAEEIIEKSTARLTKSEARTARAVIRNVQKVKKAKLGKAMEDVATFLFPNAKSEEALDLLTQVLSDKNLLDNFEPAKNDEIQIMTLHKSKGLEFDVVFHLDLYEWVLPAKSPGPGQDWDNPIYPDWDQHVNLHYVGITRAKKACYLCTSTLRINNKGDTKNARPSEFFARNNLGSLRNEI